MGKTNATWLIIADSSALVSLIHPGDSNHQRAVAISERMNHMNYQHGAITIPEDVLTETINILGKKFGHTVALAAGTHLLQSPGFIIAYTSMDLLEAGFAKFEQMPASVSLTDCLVMSWADYYNTKHIFGFDQIFATHGYQLPDASRAA